MIRNLQLAIIMRRENEIESERVEETLEVFPVSHLTVLTAYEIRSRADSGATLCMLFLVTHYQAINHSHLAKAL